MSTRLNEEMLSGMGDDALAEIAEGMLEEARTLQHNAGLSRFELARRLKDREGTHMETEHWTGRLVPSGFAHTVPDPEALRSALAAAGVTGEWLDEAVGYPKPIEPSLLVNHRTLNELQKRGGAVKAAIEAHRQSVRGEPKLELHRRAEVDLDGAGAVGETVELKE